MMHKKYIRKGEKPAKECGSCGTVWKDEWVDTTIHFDEFNNTSGVGAAMKKLMPEDTYMDSMQGVIKKSSSSRIEVNPNMCPFCDHVAEFETIKMPAIRRKRIDPNDKRLLLLESILSLQQRLEDLEFNEDIELPPSRLAIVNEITELEIKLGQIQ
jgi:hypothetical protein